MDMSSPRPPAESAAERMLAKVRRFMTQELDDQERALFAALIAPGVASAYRDDDVTGDDVAGFGTVGWLPSTLPAALADAVRAAPIRVEGLER